MNPIQARYDKKSLNIHYEKWHICIAVARYNNNIEGYGLILGILLSIYWFFLTSDSLKLKKSIIYIIRSWNYWSKLLKGWIQWKFPKNHLFNFT